jgi:hypothetical protein
MMANKRETGKFILVLKGMEDKRLRYLTAKKLAAMWPDTPFAQWKAKLDIGESVVLKRADSLAELNNFKKELDAIGAPADIVEQKSIGGAPVF